MAQPTVPHDWYFVCDCGAKFFHKEHSVECPRCGQQLRSQEQIDPPWKPKLMRVADVARLLTISASKAYELVEKGRIEHHRIDGAIRVSQEQLAEYLEETKRERGTPEPVKARRSPRPRFKHVNVR